MPGILAAMFTTSTGVLQTLTDIVVDGTSYNNADCSMGIMFVYANTTIKIFEQATDLSVTGVPQSWLSPSAGADAYDVYLQTNTGTIDGADSANTWYNLGGTEPIWYITSTDVPANRNRTYTGTLKIAANNDHATILASCNVSFAASTVESPP